MIASPTTRVSRSSGADDRKVPPVPALAARVVAVEEADLLPRRSRDRGVPAEVRVETQSFRPSARRRSGSRGAGDTARWRGRTPTRRCARPPERGARASGSSRRAGAAPPPPDPTGRRAPAGRARLRPPRVAQERASRPVPGHSPPAGVRPCARRWSAGVPYRGAAPGSADPDREQPCGRSTRAVASTGQRQLVPARYGSTRTTSVPVTQLEARGREGSHRWRRRP